MAKLIRDGDFFGPGERLAAETLERELPAAWVVIANKTLVVGDGSTREADFIVIGNHAIFVIDEKYWKGVIRGNENGWVFGGGNSTSSPIGKAEMVCRVLAGRLKKNVPHLINEIGGRPFVHARVVMSHPEVSWQINDARVGSQVFRLDRIADELVIDDGRADPHASIARFRQAIITELTGLADRPKVPKRIDPYEIVDIITDSGPSLTLLGRHEDGTERLLSVIPRHITEIKADAHDDRSTKLREYDALRRLGQMDRAPAVDPYFTWRDGAYWIVPMARVRGASLRYLGTSEGPPTPDRALAIASDAFLALAEVHDQEIVHRAVSPDAVVVEESRVRLTTFDLARLPDSVSLTGRVEPTTPEAFVAPEVRLGFGFAEPRSDVYSMAASVVCWVSGLEPAVDDPMATGSPMAASIERVLGAEGADILRRCLAKDERVRPQAREVSEGLTKLGAAAAPKVESERVATVRVPLEPDAVIDDQYRILSILGAGASGTTCLAEDTLVHRRVVLKVLHGTELVRALATNEFNVLADLAHPSLPRVFDVRPPAAPYHLKLEYVPGRTVRRLLDDGTRDPALALRVARDLGELLRYLEEKNLVHRDISASNVLVPDDASRPAVLLDFALAAAAQSTTAVGTARYRDPLVEHGEPWSPAADRYALGTLVFEMAVGRLPYQTQGAVPDKLTQLPLTDAEREGLPPGLVTGLDRMFAVNPEERPRSAADFIAGFLGQSLPRSSRRRGGEREATPQLAIAERYAIDPDTLMKGGVADVYRAIDLDTQQPVALKIIRNSPTPDRLVDLQFAREVAALKELRHPNVIRMLSGGFDPQQSRYWLALEWMPRNLAEFLGGKPVPWDRYVGAIGLPLAQALASAHERQIVHRDVKPSNVLVADDGTVKLADFGISVLKTSIPDGSHTLANFGSAPYTPPEREYLSDAVRDTFGFGVLSIEALTGKRLTDYEAMLPALDRLDLPERAHALLSRCVSLDPAERPVNGLVLETLLSAAAGSVGPGGGPGPAPAVIPCVIANGKVMADLTAAGYQAGLGSANEFLRSDLKDGAYVRRAPTEEGQEEHYFLYGQYWSYRAKVQASPPRLIVISGRAEEAEKLDRERDRCAFCPNPFGAGGTPPEYSVAQAAIEQLVDRVRVAEEVIADLDYERDERRLFNQWVRQLKASSELDASREGALAYGNARRSGAVITCTLDDEPEGSIVGQERILRASDGSGRRFRATVVDARGRTVELALSDDVRDDPPRSGVLALDMGPSAAANKRQRDALSAVRFGGSGLRRTDLPDLLLAPEHARPSVEVPVAKWVQQGLDDDKRLAVSRLLGSSDFLLVQGPPGTGKTTLIAEVVSQELRRNPDARILLTSQGHVALDNALGSLRSVIPQGFRLTRLASTAAQVAEDVRDLLLERQAPGWRREIRKRSEQFLARYASDHGIEKDQVRAALLLGNLRGLRLADEAAAEALARAHQELQEAKADQGTEHDSTEAVLDVLIEEVEAAERRMSAITREIGELADELAPLVSLSKPDTARLTVSRIDELYRARLPKDARVGSLLQRVVALQGEWLERVGRGAEFDEALLRSSHVLAATCVGLAGFSAAQNLTFDLCILDEASKAMATETLVPFVRADRWMLVGDPQQLPPFQDHALRDTGLQEDFGLDRELLGRTLFDLLWDGVPDESKVLLRQQYRMVRPIGDLISHVFYGGALISHRSSSSIGLEMVVPKPVTWYDTSRSARRQERAAGVGGTSYENHREASIIAALVARLEFIRSAKHATDVLSVLVLAPYRAQRSLIEEYIARENSALHTLRLEVNTIDAAQGREADITLLSVTRSNAAGRPGFLQERRRINVALSRARDGLVIVGDAEFCALHDGALASALEYIRENPAGCAIEIVDDE